MAQQTDEETVADMLGNARDVDGADGKISTQFATALTNTKMALKELIELDKKSFEDTIGAIVENINTYTMLKPVIRGLLFKLRPNDNGTQNRNILFSISIFCFFVCFFSVFSVFSAFSVFLFSTVFVSFLSLTHVAAAVGYDLWDIYCIILDCLFVVFVVNMEMEMEMVIYVILCEIFGKYIGWWRLINTDIDTNTNTNTTTNACAVFEFGGVGYYGGIEYGIINNK